jgi:hypothetical protein
MFEPILGSDSGVMIGLLGSLVARKELSTDGEKQIPTG